MYLTYGIIKFKIRPGIWFNLTMQYFKGSSKYGFGKAILSQWKEIGAMVHCVNQFGVSLEFGSILQAVIMKAQFIQKRRKPTTNTLDLRFFSSHQKSQTKWVKLLRKGDYCQVISIIKHKWSYTWKYLAIESVLTDCSTRIINNVFATRFEVIFLW